MLAYSCELIGREANQLAGRFDFTEDARAKVTDALTKCYHEGAAETCTDCGLTHHTKKHCWVPAQMYLATGGASNGQVNPWTTLRKCEDLTVKLAKH